MITKAALEARLAVAADFENPKVPLEQYPTPSGFAVHFVHLADLCGDIEGTTALDLSFRAEMLGLGVALRLPARVVGVEFGDDVLATTTDNARRVDASVPIDWTRTDVTRLPLCSPDDQQVTVLVNPPFGAQRDNEHANRVFPGSVTSIVDVSCSVHNEGSKEFVEPFVTDVGGDLTDAFRVTLDLGHQFDFHDEDHRQLDAEVFRVEW